MIYQYTVDPAAEVPIMLLNKHIGMDAIDGPGIMGADFQAELLALDAMGKESIQVWINSPGGVILDAYAIYNAILKSKTKVDTYAVGIAASSAALIFQAGRNRVMADYSILMYHNPQGDGDAKVMDAFKTSIVTMVASKNPEISSELISKMMNSETWINPEEALKCGFCDKIEMSGDHNKKRKLTTTNALKQAGDIAINKIINIKPKTKSKMLKVTNKLGLTEDASEDSILSAVILIADKNTALEAENKVTKKAVDAAKAAYDELKASFDAQKNDLDAAQDKAKSLEDKIKEDEAKGVDAKAKNLIDGYVASGKIKNTAENIAAWVNIARTDYEGAKILIEELPINSKAVKIEVKSTEAVQGSHIGRAEADLRNRLKI